MEAILGAPGCRVQGFLAAGHVCAVMGWWEYEPIAERHRVPIVVTGFEPLDVLEGIRKTVVQLESGSAAAENAYTRAVNFDGNKPAQKLIADVFETTDRNWRGIGMIPGSGWELSDRYAEYDAARRFEVADIATQEPAICRSGEVLQGPRSLQ